MNNPRLYIVVPCYNEQEVLPITAPMFLDKLGQLAAEGKISADSRLLLVDDGSRDGTWDIISGLAEADERCIGIRQSRNRGHQNAVLAGLMEAKDSCDITISIDCDGQDDINAMDRMVDEYLGGCEVVYGVRSERKSDSFFKRTTAQGFYKFLAAMGAEVVYNHADYRLISSRVLRELAGFKEVNLYLRGMVPLVGFKSTSIEYARAERLAGDSKYPLRKMLSLAADGITSLSVKPLRLATFAGMFTAFIGFIYAVIIVIKHFVDSSIPEGWSSTMALQLVLGGIILVVLGLIGEYIGRIYMCINASPQFVERETVRKEEQGN